MLQSRPPAELVQQIVNEAVEVELVITYTKYKNISTHPPYV